MKMNIATLVGGFMAVSALRAHASDINILGFDESQTITLDVLAETDEVEIIHPTVEDAPKLTNNINMAIIACPSLELVLPDFLDGKAKILAVSVSPETLQQYLDSPSKTKDTDFENDALYDAFSAVTFIQPNGELLRVKDEIGLRQAVDDMTSGKKPAEGMNLYDPKAKNSLINYATEFCFSIY